jgi:hypothetical protein
MNIYIAEKAPFKIADVFMVVCIKADWNS